MNNTLPDFLIIPRVIILDEELQPLDGYVYGVIYWYKGMRLQKCFAKSEKIAKLLTVTEGSVQNSINRLIKKGHVMSIYHRAKHQRELIPMVPINSITSNDLVAPHQMMDSTTSNDVKVDVQLVTPNKKIKEEDINKSINTNVLIEGKPSYGNVDINTCTAYFAEKLDIPKEDCTQAESRRYWSLLLKESKKGVDGVRWLIDIAASDEFFRNNITSSKDLYYKRVKLIARVRGNKPKIAVMGENV